MAKRFTVELRNEIAEIRRLHLLVEQLGRANGLPAAVVNAVNVSLDEVVANIIHHGHTDGGEHQIAVRVEVDDERVRVEVEDDARPFNPLEEAPTPDIEADLEGRAVGGVGVFLVKSMMDRVEYHRVADRNLLVMEKTTADPEESQ